MENFEIEFNNAIDNTIALFRHLGNVGNLTIVLHKETEKFGTGPHISVHHVHSHGIVNLVLKMF